MKRETENYFNATEYARLVLRDAPSYFPRLHELSRTNTLDEMIAIIDSWCPALPRPIPLVPTSTCWTPCKHFGGDHECPRCVRENTKAGLIYAGAMAKADEMFKQHQAFVRRQIHAELLPFTQGKPYQEFDDLEQKVWQNVAAHIAGYADTGTPLAWLKIVVHNTVVTYWRDRLAAKRGEWKTGQFPERYDIVNPASPISVPAQSTAIHIDPAKSTKTE